MKTSNSISDSEIAVIQADAAQLQGRMLHWVLSRKQIVYVLQEIEETKTADADFNRARYLDEQLPVINLEQYFGIGNSDYGPAAYYLVVRAAKADGTITKAIIPSRYPARIRKLDFETVPVEKNDLFKNKENISGLFLSGDTDSLAAPDIAAIIERGVNRA